MPRTHAQWVDPNSATFQHVPDKHVGHRRGCVDAKCRAFNDGYRRGILDALKVERAFRAVLDA